MWILTEDGALVDFTHASSIFTSHGVVWASLLNDGGNSAWLCSCDDEAHGKRIIVELAHHIHDAHKDGNNVITIHDVKRRLPDDV